MARMQLKERGSPVYTYRDGGVWDEWTVSRSALSKEGARWLPVRKPNRYVGEIFQSLARAEGLYLPLAEVSRSVVPGVTLVSHESASLADIVQKMLKYSTNLTAETVGMAATKTRLGTAVPLGESAAQMSRWARDRFGASGLSLVDHSGLSDRSRITADDMVRILIKARESTELYALLKDIKMRNAKGNLARSAPTGFRAKTGTLNFVAGLGGYVTTASGRELAFAIFSADRTRRALIPVAQRERPKGASSWNRRAKILQYKMLNRWCHKYRS
jgi:D-alanyl-D-alanine carboxypeptidase/D-alanyl-D-alanine-endopeptidase (penicillin-binding protein 4)